MTEFMWNWQAATYWRVRSALGIPYCLSYLRELNPELCKLCKLYEFLYILEDVVHLMPASSRNGLLQYRAKSCMVNKSY